MSPLKKTNSFLIGAAWILTFIAAILIGITTTTPTATKNPPTITYRQPSSISPSSTSSDSHHPNPKHTPAQTILNTINIHSPSQRLNILFNLLNHIQPDQFPETLNALIKKQNHLNRTNTNSPRYEPLIELLPFFEAWGKTDIHSAFQHLNQLDQLRNQNPKIHAQLAALRGLASQNHQMAIQLAIDLKPPPLDDNYTSGLDRIGTKNSPNFKRLVASSIIQGTFQSAPSKAISLLDNLSSGDPFNPYTPQKLPSKPILNPPLQASMYTLTTIKDFILAKGTEHTLQTANQLQNPVLKDQLLYHLAQHIKESNPVSAAKIEKQILINPEDLVGSHEFSRDPFDDDK